MLKWFGDDTPKGYTSRFDSWQYLSDIPELAQTRAVMATHLDMRIPLTFTLEDCACIAEIIVDEVGKLAMAAD